MTGRSLMQLAHDAREEIEIAQAKLRILQSQCTHPIEVQDIKAVCGGEYDNQYTNHITCGVCGHFWVEDQ